MVLPIYRGKSLFDVWQVKDVAFDFCHLFNAANSGNLLPAAVVSVQVWKRHRPLKSHAEMGRNV